MNTPSTRHYIWVIAGIVTGTILFSVLSNHERNFVAGDVGLGLNTVGVVEEIGGRRISGHFSDAAVLRESFKAFKREGRRVALWIGASQVHAINNPKKGDHVAVWYGSKLASQRGSDLAYILMSEPNANLHEMLCMYLAFKQADLIPDLLVMSFTYDDLQEPGIRQSASEALRPLSAEVLRLGGAAAGEINEAIGKSASEEEVSVPIERNVSTGTLQERIESSVVNSLESVWPSYSWRGQLRSRVIAAVQIRLTTLMFSLFTPPKRPIPEAMRKWNESALAALTALAKADGVRMLIYKAPYRQEWQNSRFEQSVYESYHAGLEASCEQAGNSYIDLETIVPIEFWGRTNGGDPDFYHFTDAGHRLLGAAIDARLGDEGY